MDMLAEYRALNAGIAQIDTIHRALVRDRTTIQHDVDSLLAGDWTGGAATAFAGGWQEWTGDADVVLAALDTMRTLMTEALVDLEHTDGFAASGIAQLQTRLGGV